MKIRVDAIGADAFGNELLTAGDVTLTSSVASDEIRGATETFNHASPHVITAPVGAVSASMLIEVSPTAVVTPPTSTDPLEPTAPAAEPTTGAVVAPVAYRSGQATTTRDAEALAYTGATGTGSLAVAALLAVVLGQCLHSGVRRIRQRS